MTTTDLIFLDIETTGLTDQDEVWEIGAIRRHHLEGGDIDETTLHLFVQHDTNRALDLPEEFRTDHDARWYGADHVYTRVSAATILHAFLHRDNVPRPHIVGANPAFDVRFLHRLFQTANLDDPWHYHLIDIEALTLGYLAAAGTPITVPWQSDSLADAVGLDVGAFARHTALGDAEFVRAWWNHLDINIDQ